MPKTFANLCRLHISLIWWPIVIPRDDILSRTTADILDPFDDMLSQLCSQLRDCSIGICSSIWFAIAVAGIWSWTRFKCSEHSSVAKRSWRPLLGLASGSNPGDRPGGYWIAEGFKNDTPYPFAHINLDYRELASWAFFPITDISESIL